MLLLQTKVLGDGIVPDFDKMKVFYCKYDETFFNADNSVVSKSNKSVVLRFDDEYSKLYVQKEPVVHIKYYDSDRVEFELHSMTDDYISLEKITVNRLTGEYSGQSRITYDNEAFESRFSKISGICKN